MTTTESSYWSRIYTYALPDLPNVKWPGARIEYEVMLHVDRLTGKPIYVVTRCRSGDIPNFDLTGENVFLEFSVEVIKDLIKVNDIAREKLEKAKILIAALTAQLESLRRIEL